jgi:alpha-1,3-rhamnosyl/mannosyltransferase
MRIVYNLDCIRAPMTGVAYYTLNMVSSIIQQHPDADIAAFRHNQLLSKQAILDLFSQTSLPSARQSTWKKQAIEMINHSFIARQLIQTQQSLHHQLRLKHKLHNAIYHEPNFVLLPHNGKKVLTVHDVSMFDCPEFLPKGRAHFLQHHLRRGMKEADALIVSCQFIKNRVLDLTHIDEKKIHIIAPGAQENFMPRTETETHAALQKFSLRYKQFLLCVATLEPRKNLARLIHAYQKLSPDLQQAYPLILVGNKGWLYEELLALMTRNPASNIVLLRYVDQQTLFHLYSAAKAFVYPSLYEGFGLPVLEAMQSGTPVISSNVSSLPEVCGDAGILIDPLDEVKIATAIEKILTTDNVHYAALVENSRARAKQFSWQHFARQLFDVYKNF